MPPDTGMQAIGYIMHGLFQGLGYAFAGIVVACLIGGLLYVASLFRRKP